jgi:hypothetical protein
MNRGQFVRSVILPLLSCGCASAVTSRSQAPFPTNRVRPADPGWPADVNSERLRQEVGGRLINVQSPLTTCQSAPAAESCADVLRKLKNPYYIGDHPALTQTSGWVDTWNVFAQRIRGGGRDDGGCGVSRELRQNP